MYAQKSIQEEVALKENFPSIGYSNIKLLNNWVPKFLPFQKFSIRAIDMLYAFINLCTREQILFVASRKPIFTVALEKDNPKNEDEPKN